MKKIILVLNAMMLMFLVNGQSLTTPQPSPTASVKQNFALGSIELNYSRPGKKDRVIMGGLVPYGKVWRTGANDATTIRFTENVTIGGKEVKAGTYGLLTIPGEKKWTIIITKDVNVSNPANYKEENDVVRVEADVVTTPYTIETFTIGVGDISNSSCKIELMWEKTYVQFPVTVDIDTKVMKQIDDVMNKDTKPYYNAASYYYENGKDKKQALAWVTKAVETNKNAFWMFLLKARLHKELGDKEACKAAANTCIELATKQKNDEYVNRAKELIAGL